MTRILIADDHPVFRRGLAMVLADADELIVCGEAASAEEVVRVALVQRPDLILLDLSMPGGGLDVIGMLRQDLPETRIAVLTASESDSDVLAALRAGAHGYIVKGIDSRTLIEAIREIAAGRGYVAPDLAARMLTELSMADFAGAPARTNGGGLDLLTPREAQVLKLVAGGLSNKEIALTGHMQEKTVKHHMSRIMQKLQVRNRTEAAMVLRAADRPE